MHKVILLALVLLQILAAERLSVNVGIVLPHSNFHRRSYQNAIAKGLSELKRNTSAQVKERVNFQRNGVKMALLSNNPSPTGESSAFLLNLYGGFNFVGSLDTP